MITDMAKLARRRAEDLARLRSVIRVGWITDTTDYDNLPDSRTGVVRLLSENLPHHNRPGYITDLDRPIRSQGLLYRAVTNSWPLYGSDYEVHFEDPFGREAWILDYYQESAGSRVRAVRVQFSPPR